MAQNQADDARRSATDASIRRSRLIWEHACDMSSRATRTIRHADERLRRIRRILVLAADRKTISAPFPPGGENSVHLEITRREIIRLVRTFSRLRITARDNGEDGSGRAGAGSR